MNNRNQLSSIFWVAISVVVCLESLRAGLGTFRYPGPGFFLFLSGSILGVLTIILFITSILMKTQGGETKHPWREKKWRNVILVLTSLFLYAFFINKIGYLITTFGLLTFFLGMIGKPRLLMQMAGALITTFVTYFVFHFLLAIPLPKGIFGY